MKKEIPTKNLDRTRKDSRLIKSTNFIQITVFGNFPTTKESMFKFLFQDFGIDSAVKSIFSGYKYSNERSSTSLSERPNKLEITGEVVLRRKVGTSRRRRFSGTNDAFGLPVDNFARSFDCGVGSNDECNALISHIFDFSRLKHLRLSNSLNGFPSPSSIMSGLEKIQILFSISDKSIRPIQNASNVPSNGKADNEPDDSSY